MQDSMEIQHGMSSQKIRNNKIKQTENNREVGFLKYTHINISLLKEQSGMN